MKARHYYLNQNTQKKNTQRKIIPLKNELLCIAKKIKFFKSIRKMMPDGHVSALDKLQKEYRYKHVAYSLLKGRSQHEIEFAVRDKNTSDFNELEVSQFLLQLLENS